MPRKKIVDGPETNVGLVTRLMTFAKSGPVAQLFIIESIRRYADQCADADPKKMDVGFISGTQWKRAAAEIREELAKHLET
jgi:hypothetical protein